MTHLHSQACLRSLETPRSRKARGSSQTCFPEERDPDKILAPTCSNHGEKKRRKNKENTWFGFPVKDVRATGPLHHAQTWSNDSPSWLPAGSCIVLRPWRENKAGSKPKGTNLGNTRPTRAIIPAHPGRIAKCDDLTPEHCK